MRKRNQKKKKLIYGNSSFFFFFNKLNWRKKMKIQKQLSPDTTLKEVVQECEMLNKVHNSDFHLSFKKIENKYFVVFNDN